MKKKLTIFLLVFVMLFGTLSFVNAAEINTKLTIVKDASETKELENDQVYISKTIVDSDLDKGEVTIELKLSNTKKNKSQEERFENTEVYIIIPENAFCRNGESKTKYFNNLESLISKILEKNSKTKVGIIGIQGPKLYFKLVDGNYEIDQDNENDECFVDGTANDAEIIIRPSNSLTEIKNAIQETDENKTSGYYQNLQAALRLANNSFSDNVNKILISLYDSVSDVAIGVRNGIIGSERRQYGDEGAIKRKHDKLATAIRSEIFALKDAKIDFVLLRPADTSYDEHWYDTGSGETVLDFDGSPYMQKIYGTLDNPTYGKMYSYTDETIDTVIRENIYSEVQKLIQTGISNVKVVDYFPDDIMENFDFSYVGDPSNGTASEEIDEETKTITWNIGDLEGEEVATLKYKLKLKDMKNEELLDKEIATNEKVVLTYKDAESEDYEVIFSSSPKIKLVEEKEELTATVTYDPTEETTGKVTATIKTNKKVNEVEGWTLSEDGKTLTKEYTANVTETVHLVDIDEMTKDVEIVINNIKKVDQKDEEPKKEETKEDNTLADKPIPKAGDTFTFIVTFGIALIALITIYFKVKSYKDIK